MASKSSWAINFDCVTLDKSLILHGPWFPTCKKRGSREILSVVVLSFCHRLLWPCHTFSTFWVDVAQNMANQGFRAEGSEPRFRRTPPRTPQTPGHSGATLAASLSSPQSPSAALDVTWFPALPASEAVPSGLLRGADVP